MEAKAIGPYCGYLLLKHVRVAYVESQRSKGSLGILRYSKKKSSAPIM